MKNTIENPTSLKPEGLEKEKQYELLCGGKPDCISVLGQWIVEKKSKTQSRLESAPYSARDSDGNLVGGKARVIATAEIAKYFPDAQIITNSRGIIKQEGTGKKIPVNLALIMSQELKKLGANKEKIILNEYSYSVFSELTELIKIIVKNNWRNVAVITNEYQIPRCEAMLTNINELDDPNGESKKEEFKKAYEEFRNMEISIKFVAAEDILPLRSRHYKKLIDEARNSDAWKARVELEKTGTEQIKNGQYWKNLPKHFIRPEDF